MARAPALGNERGGVGYREQKGVIAQLLLRRAGFAGTQAVIYR